MYMYVFYVHIHLNKTLNYLTINALNINNTKHFNKCTIV